MNTPLRIIAVFLVFLFLGVPFQNMAQQPGNSRIPEYAELPDDPYVLIEKAGRASSPAYHYTTARFTTVQANVNEAGENMLGDAANEPSLAIDPTNPDRMIIGWRQFDTIASNFRQAGFAYTTDGGQRWTFPGVIEPGVFRSDPVLDFNTEGQIYYNSLSSDVSNYFCHVFKSTGDGAWDEGAYAYGGDKQWMVIDRSGGQGDGHLYANWKQSFSACFPGSTTRSTDGGATFEDCVETMGEPIRGTLAVGPQGELYAFGQQGESFVIARSFTARDPALPVTWDLHTEVPLGGPIGLYDGPNPGGMLGQAWVATDHSGGATNGNVYALCSVERQDIDDPLDVMFSRSTDGGETWSEPLRINDDLPGEGWQWFGTLAVAPNGRIDVVWLDTRLDPGGLGSALFHSSSTDGGLNWSSNEQLSEIFDPHLGWPNQTKMGDYFHMISDNAGAHLAWAATFNGEQDVYYSYIPAEPIMAEKNLTESNRMVESFPNPFSSSTNIRYRLEAPGLVQLNVFNSYGQLVHVLEKGQKLAGRHTASWDGRRRQGGWAPAGLYFYQLTINGSVIGVGRMVKI